MRQVGDRLIPVGVSSSRLGAELPPGSTTGPGGAIIIQDGARWGGLGRSGNAEGRSSTRSRRELSQLLQLGGGAEVEEMMMMEAMRLSLLEHEEQQRRQAQSQSRDNATSSSADPASDETTTEAGRAIDQAAEEEPGAVSSTSATAAAAGASLTTPALAGSSTLADQQVLPHPTRSSSLAASPPRVAPVNMGLSTSMMAELSELIDGAPPRAPESTEPTSSTSNQQPASSVLTSQALPTSSDAIPSSLSSHTHQSSSAMGHETPGSSPPAISTPSRIGTNPNNPFRRMAGGSSNPATPANHSRQGSGL